MQNVKNSPKAALVQSLVTGVVLGILSASTALAGGLGYNGPTLTTISIPGSADHGIRLKNIEKAYMTCLADGDAQRGLVPFVVKVAEQMGFQIPAGNRPSLMSEQLETNFAEQFVQFQGIAIYGYIEGTEGRSPVDDYVRIEVLGQKDGSKLRVTIKSPETKNVDRRKEEITLEPNNSSGNGIDLQIPLVHAEKFERDSGYDRWGRPTQSELVFQGVSLLTPKDAKIDLYANERKILTLDLADLVSCLRSEIQNGLE